MPRVLTYTSFPTPIGVIYAAATSQGVCRLTFDATDEGFEEELITRYGARVLFAPQTPLLKKTEEQFERYFLGELRQFELPFDFLEGTPFYKRVWDMLLKIPYGQVRSYRWVAEQVGLPQGARAVGQANSRNRIAILIPCHRVINNDGRIGGYGDRLDVKEYLLELEQAQWKRSAI